MPLRQVCQSCVLLHAFIHPHIHPPELPEQNLQLTRVTCVQHTTVRLRACLSRAEDAQQRRAALPCIEAIQHCLVSVLHHWDATQPDLRAEMLGARRQHNEQWDAKTMASSHAGTLVSLCAIERTYAFRLPQPLPMMALSRYAAPLGRHAAGPARRDAAGQAPAQ